MKRLLKVYVLGVIGILFTLSSCDSNEGVMDIIDPVDDVETFPYLKVVNAVNDTSPIINVELVGYEFSNLNIIPGTSQTFVLDNGMPGGYDDINIVVTYQEPGTRGYPTIKVDFNDDETTTVTLKGCRGMEGCPGIYLE